MDQMDQMHEAQPAAEEPAAQSVEERTQPAGADCPPALITVCDVRFRNGSKTYFFDPNGLSPVSGDHVIIDTARGAEFGYCVGANHQVEPGRIVAPLRRVLRVATAEDERVNRENEEQERRAFSVCLQKIEEHRLDMQLVSAECAFDGSKILFFFTADERVDFRDLVKHLASIFRTRIELRQIGVRDKAKMVGGLGICGRPFCCKQFLDDFQPVSIKMAKTQNLSLNPTKISGSCGRLMCCLKYEQDAYEDLIKTSPKPESFVDTPDGRGTVIDLNLLRQTVRVRMEDRPDEVGVYRNSEIAVLRNGKGKKTDPPIPAELAPISGGSNRPARRTLSDTLEPQSQQPLLDSIIIKSMAEDIPAVEAQQTEEAPRTSRRRRGERADRQKAEKPADAAEKPERQPKGDQPAKGDKSHRKDKPAKARGASTEKGEKPARGDNGQKGEKPAKPEKNRRAEKNEQADQSPKAQHPAKPERKPRPEKKPGEGDRPEANKGGEKPAKAHTPKAENPVRGEKAPKAAEAGGEDGGKKEKSGRRRNHFYHNRHRGGKPKAE